MNNFTQEQQLREQALYTGHISVYCFIILVHFFWAISGPLTKMCYDGFGLTGGDVLEVIHFAGIRLLGAGLIGLAYLAARRESLLPTSLADLWQLTKVSLIMGVVQYIFFNFGAAFSSGVQTSILSSAGAFSGILISALIFKEDALTARKIGGCVLGVVAVVILNWPDICAGVTTSLFGTLLLLLGQVSGSFGAAYMKLVSRDRSAIWVGSWQSLISGVLLIAAGLAGKAPLSFRGAGAPLVPSLVLVVTSGAALIFSSQLYKYNPLSKIMIFSLLSPVFGVFSSAIMLGDPLNSGYVVVSLLLNCLGVALVTTEKPAA